MQNLTRQIGGIEVTQRKKDGYINATELCRVYEIQTGAKKTPYQWFETNRANRYIELVSSETGIPVSQLFIANKGYSIRHEQGTWIHPDLASPFASWLSPEYELMVSRWVQEWMRTGQNPIQKQAEPSAHIHNLEEATLEEIFSIFKSLNSLGIDTKLVESAKLTAVAKSIPRLSVAAEEGKRLISSQMSVAELPMSPTELGICIAKRLGLSELPSAQKVNQALREAGLQKIASAIDSQGKQKKNWILTESGEEYGQLQMDTARGHNKTVFCIRWFSSVIPVIEAVFKPSPEASLKGT